MLDLLNADYTFVNERLAQHYGIPEHLRPGLPRACPLPSDARRGLLGQGSMLAGHLQRQPHFSGAARQVDSRKHSGQPAAAASAQRSAAQGKSGGAGRACRSASAWRSTAPIRSARDATRSWTRSGCRSRISTASAGGGTDGLGLQDRLRPANWWMAPRIDGPASSAQGLLARPDAFRRAP